MKKYFPPMHLARQFNCIYCEVYAAQQWKKLFYQSEQGGIFSVISDLDFCICTHCNRWSFWYETRMILPAEAPVPVAHSDMPSDCLSDYNEARAVVAVSPKAACALLRLALQKLLVDLGERGKNINDDIGSLVAKGLPVEVQQALDYCRVVGNHAVHPGQIDFSDTPEMAHYIFEMINFIVEDRISRPRDIQARYARLPEDARKAIASRDSKKG